MTFHTVEHSGLPVHRDREGQTRVVCRADPVPEARRIAESGDQGGPVIGRERQRVRGVRRPRGEAGNELRPRAHVACHARQPRRKFARPASEDPLFTEQCGIESGAGEGDLSVGPGNPRRQGVAGARGSHEHWIVLDPDDSETGPAQGRSRQTLARTDDQNTTTASEPARDEACGHDARSPFANAVRIDWQTRHGSSVEAHGVLAFAGQIDDLGVGMAEVAGVLEVDGPAVRA